MPATPSAAAEHFTGSTAVGEHRLSRGLTEVTLTDGRVVVVKHCDDPGAARAEAAGLRWLAAADAVRVPAVHGHDGTWLVTDRVAEGRASAAGAERFGRDLAALHAAGAPAFGAPPPDGPAEAYIGLAPMRNAPGDTWPEWFAEQRVLPYVRQAVDGGTLRADEARTVERVCALLPGLAGPAEPPARLHGDLWNGNVLWDGDGAAWLIDPAAHGGHRESDLAMLDLFGAPHLDRILAGYQDAAPLADGWRERIRLHQLFPLLVHTVLFGRAYAAQAVAAARSQLT
ncbi:fructosamine kinase family protein [Streptomyces sp. NPDC001904]|uniref:fructosamine kinase family protein n=1 Tax=Streptomyces sp. NPDC001904 TaxID=3154531 RepID=UPI003333E2CA